MSNELKLAWPFSSSIFQQRSLMVDRILLILIWCVPFGCLNAQATARMHLPVDIDVLVRNFGVLALSAEYEEEPEKIINKWVSPIRIQLSGAGREEFHSLVVSYASTLEAITTLSISVETVNTNVEILLYDHEKLQELYKDYGSAQGVWRDFLRGPELCTFVFYTNEAHEIEEATILIPVYYGAGLVGDCVEEELAQILGLANDSPDAYPSIFNDDGEFNRLTAHDILLLQILYDDRMKPGTNEDEARRLARIILNDIEFSR